MKGKYELMHYIKKIGRNNHREGRRIYKLTLAVDAKQEMTGAQLYYTGSACS